MTGWQSIDEVAVLLDFGRDGRVAVGTLASDRTGRTFFEYDRHFAGRGIDPAPLLWNTEPALLDVSPSGAEAQTTMLTGMFRDALPDGWAKRILFQRLTDAKVDPRHLTALDLLSLVGANRVGALYFDPVRILSGGMVQLTLDDLAATVLGTGEDGDAGVAIAQKLAGSLGGARPKASLWFDGDRPSAVPLAGAHPWIIKFPNPLTDTADSGAIEFAYSRMASAAGISMPPTRLLPGGNGPGFFAVSRFDQMAGRRFHFQSLSGLVDRDPIAGGTYQELLLNHMAITSTSQPDEQLVRRMIFNAVASVRDDHVRNHGFLMDASGTWVASPAYDVTFDDLNRHQLSIGPHSHDPGVDDLRDVVISASGDPEMVERLTPEIRDVVAEWPAFAREAGLPASSSERVSASISPVGGGRRILGKQVSGLLAQAARLPGGRQVKSKGPSDDQAPGAGRSDPELER